MNDKDLKTILQQTFKEIYGDLGSLATMAKKGMPSMEKQIEEIEQRCKQNLVAIEIQTAIK
ncbi:hypothetical protein AXI59_16790 [Bacillus nakamurai]|uniref:Uncharacterized protein n=1 Tax=Bacillus nakamurai TaxID=1793963 RepID=A0A150FAI1_9BACI|nr:hypothetical protein [Bacillus nakamurai]KXZ18088.1 hypothetical protein AXI59_16790 [Bacillus nakamurai]KXZ21658.1 hypothetical protein AXI58_11925 [Bacillus nakamurai]MCC9021509.1 hypothetical protein [Bacillus nakamurai]MCP6682128.1 hypothetical protein [Bacillus nakamurai]MED1226526.1 hypothetical protein [Bacillus nakamurai]